MTMYKNDIDKYMTPAEACQIYGVSRKTLNSRLNSDSDQIKMAIKNGLLKKFVNDGATRAQWIISSDFMDQYYLFDNNNRDQDLKYYEYQKLISSRDNLMRYFEMQLDRCRDDIDHIMQNKPFYTDDDAYLFDLRSKHLTRRDLQSKYDFLCNMSFFDILN